MTLVAPCSSSIWRADSRSMPTTSGMVCDDATVMVTVEPLRWRVPHSGSHASTVPSSAPSTASLFTSTAKPASLRRARASREVESTTWGMGVLKNSSFTATASKITARTAAAILNHFAGIFFTKSARSLAASEKLFDPFEETEEITAVVSGAEPGTRRMRWVTASRSTLLECLPNTGPLSCGSSPSSFEPASAAEA